MKSENTMDHDLERRLMNWARWRCGSSTFSSLSPYPAYNLALRGPRADSVMPVLNGEAIDTDEAISQLPERYKHVVWIEYLWTDSMDSKARRCGCCRRAYYYRLDEAKDRLKREFYRPALRGLDTCTK